MGSITIQFSDESDKQMFVDLLAKAIRQATAEPLAPGRAAQAEAATNEVRVRRPPEANRSASAKMN
jgi:hypothetical protein